MKRTQIYLDESQQERLRVAALARGTTTSALIREAVDRYLARDEMTIAEKREKIRQLGERFAKDPAFVGVDPVEYVEESRARSARKLQSYRDGSYRHHGADRPE
jgi:hypothetical protein